MLDRLPPEAVDRICSQLALWRPDGYYKRLHHPVYLLPLCLVCKAWTSPAQRNLYKYLSFHEPYSETKLLKLLSNRALLGKRHQIVRLQWRDTFKDEADLIYATRAMIGLLHYSKDSLKALSMGEYAESETQDLLLALSGLSNIREFSTDNLDLSVVMGLAANCYPNLQSLFLDKPTFSNPLPASALRPLPSTLNHIGFYSPIDGFGDNDFELLLDLAGAELKTLALWEFCQKISPEAILRVLQRVGPQLTTLEVVPSQKNVTFLGQQLKACNNLKLLEIGINDNMNDVLTLALPTGLVYLCLYDVPKSVDLESIKPLFDSLPKLSDLCLVNLQDDLEHEKAIQEECDRRGISFHLTYLQEETKPQPME